jgi:phosphotransferase family enzyme
LGRRIVYADPQIATRRETLWISRMSAKDRNRSNSAPPPFSAEELGRGLGGVPGFQWLHRVPPKIQIQTLRVHPAGHSTFEIVLYTDGRSESLIGKVYPSDRQDVYRIMEGLWQAGFGSEAEFSIPQPIVYLPSLRLLLQERVVGTLAKEIFKHGDERQRFAAAERCARWLAHFHATAPPMGRVLEVEKFLRWAERKCRLISEGGGPLATRAGELFERLRAAAPSPGAIPVCAGHGDYCEHQVIFAEGRTAVVDWDLYDIADPARDLAKFVVSLGRLAGRHLGSRRALDGAAEVLLKTYIASGGHPQVAAHLPFYKAALWLKGRKDAIQTKAPGWCESAEVMLDEGLRSLPAGGGIQVEPPGLVVD